MASYKLYEVYCIEEAMTRRLTSLTEPTQCPATHNDRTIDTNQTVLIDYKPIKGNRVEFLTPKMEKVSNKNYSSLKTNFFFDASVMEMVVDFKIIAYIQDKTGSGSYDFKVYDETHGLELGSVNLTNTSLGTYSVGDINNFPTEDAIIEFHVKVDNAKNKANIGSIAVYYKTIS
jgi:hypothetical protein